MVKNDLTALKFFTRWTAFTFLLFTAISCSSGSRQGDEPAGAIGKVPVNYALAWEEVPGASGYDVYFGSSNPPAFQCRVTRPKFLLETLSAGQQYYWRADPVIAGQSQPGKVNRIATESNPTREEVFAWPIRIANSLYVQYPTPAKLSGWNYTEGMMMDALYSIATQTVREQDFTYIQQWLDRFVSDSGQIDPSAYDFKLFSLDRIRPGPVLLWMYDRTKQEKYLTAAKVLASQIDQQPRTSDGGMWHRSTYPNQMWLDGIYMADLFAVEYGVKTNQPKYVDDAVKQILLIAKHTYDPQTGLFYHGWDETKSRPWANKQTGASPEFWGRAIGWYAMAMADVLDWLPADHPGRKQVLSIFQSLCATLLKYQDRETAMWFQILDKPTAPKNYVETSCSIMFAYAMTRGAQRGWLPAEYAEYAKRATRGIINHKVDLLPDNCMDIRDTVSVGSLGGNGGFYDYYVSVPLAKNDTKAVGAFMYLSLAMSEAANK